MSFLVLFILIAILALIIGACVSTVLRACTVPRGVSRGGSCGNCAYAYSGWTRCPECGNDIADVGVATPRLVLRYRGSGAHALLGILFVGLAAGFILIVAIMGIAQARGWSAIVCQTQYTLSDPQDATAPAPIPATPVCTVHWDVTSSDNVTARGEILIVLNPAGGAPVATTSRPATRGMRHAVIDARTGDLTSYDAQGRRIADGPAFTAADAESLLRDSGLPISESDLPFAGQQLAAIADADEVMNRVARSAPPSIETTVVFAEGTTAIMTAPSLPFTLFGLRGMAAAFAISALVAGALTVVLLTVVFRRRRRLLAPVTPRVPDPASP